MQVEVVKRKTKSFRLSVNSDGIIKASVPLFASKQQIDTFIASNKEWIAGAIKRVIARQNERKQCLAEYHGKIMYQGIWYDVQFDSSAKSVLIENSVLICKDTKMLAIWLKNEALRIFTPKCMEIASFYGVNVTKVSVRVTKSRWGSCSIGGNISLNTNLIKAPRGVIEYVIIHEVAHLIEHNHSSAFWQQVQKLCPNYKAHSKWLKENGWLLVNSDLCSDVTH